MVEIRVQIPPDLLRDVEQRIAAGQFPDMATLLAEALRYYVERHREEDWQDYVSKEISWSLRHADG